MGKAKLFLYDFVTNKKIRKYIIAIVIFLVAALYYHKNNNEWMLGTAAMSNIGLSIAFLTTLYSIFSYSTIDRIKAYLMLPCKKSEVFFSFVFAQYFSLLLERMSFVIIVAAFFTKEPVLIVAYLLLSSLIAVVLDTVVLISLNKKRYFLAALSVVFIAALYVLLTYSQNSALNFTVLVVLLCISIFIVMTFESKHLAINRESKVKSNPFRRVNYFSTVMMREKIVLVNTASVFVIAGLFALISKETPFLLNLIWGVIAVNTPATTMFSGDKALMRQEKMLPRHSRLMNGVYGSFLAVYFMIANSYVVLLFVLLGQFNIFVLFTGIVLVVVETGIALLLERKYPIRSWQKKQEVWRNPRKYILPVIVFAITFVPYFWNSM